MSLLAGILAVGLAAQAAEADFVWFERAPAHTTVDIRRMDPAATFVCIETPHFKLACALGPMKLPSDDAERRRIEADLKTLTARGIEGLRGKSRLDTRARAHLYGLRLERVYADVLELLAMTDADFPAIPPRARDADYAGEGPFLGMPKPFTVLLTERETTLARYVQTYGNRACTPVGVRHFFQSEGTLFLGIAADGNEGRLRDDKVLHAALVYNTVHNLLDGFRYYWHETPLWLQEGTAHWFRRQVLEDMDLYTWIPPDLPERNRRTDWRATALARARLGNFTPLREVLGWIDDRAVRFGDQIAIWSRIDFLQRRHPGALGRILRATKRAQPSDQSATPDDQALVERQRAALADVLGLDPDRFDDAWVAFVKETYGSR